MKNRKLNLDLITQLETRAKHLLSQFEAAKAAGMKRLDLDVEPFIEKLAEPIATMSGFLLANITAEEDDA